LHSKEVGKGEEPGLGVEHIARHCEGAAKQGAKQASLICLGHVSACGLVSWGEGLLGE